MEHQKKVVIIGAGIAGLTAAALLAKAGFGVTVIEQNDQPGGRARTWTKDGFVFDMGPSWYWMPDIYDDLFALFGKKVSDFYSLTRLDPGYRIHFGKDDSMDVPASQEELAQLFEQHEPGSSANLNKFLDQAAHKYKVGMGEYVFKPSHSFTEYLSLPLLKQSINIQMFSSMRKHVAHFFKNPKLVKLLEFPVLFLGATPQNTPALYSMMNYADLALGTWYPMGGMNEIARAMAKLAEECGAVFKYNEQVKHINLQNKEAKQVNTNLSSYNADLVIANADYHHADQELIDKEHRNYTPAYWNSRTLSPSSLLYYIGLNKRIEGILHHNLFFDEDFELHAHEIYTQPQWPSKPLFYVCCPSKTDPTVAPEGCENLFFLMPLAPGLNDTEQLREQYFERMVARFEAITGQQIRESILVKRSYAMKDFETDYHSFKGNAYGLANTLFQTAFLKPKMRSKSIKNLLYTGQLTVPGPGVPPAIISGRIAANETINYFRIKP